MPARPAAIRTPDQRIRVFVSSTLKELEPERGAARAAIERLRLAPVMFELGARAHPPRQLYRSYLAQSDIFVGLYWERYGWVAPGERISGLEDEYLLSSGHPSLIYIKEPAPRREPQLARLLDRIRTDDRSSYKTFGDADELAELLQGDIATLLAERFDATATGPASPGGAKAAITGIPAPYNPLVGRESEHEELIALLARPDVRIATILGPGGIGKSRLAIEVAGEIARSGKDVAFALLESVRSPERTITAIARALGVRDSGEQDLEDAVVAALKGREVLLVVDNLEHLLESSDLLVRLITVLPGLTLLVTSRSAMRVRAEHAFVLGPLALPPEEASVDEVRDAAATALFIQRATATRPAFALTGENAAAIAAICRTLEGVPLAIELAAARVRSMAPGEILSRLDSALSLLVGGARDLPERQRALRNTIAWSVDLLDDGSRLALAALAVFTGRFSVLAAEDVLAGVGTSDPLEALDALVEASLLRQDDQGGTAAFALAPVVRAYAAALAPADVAAAAREAWLGHYEAAAREASVALRGSDELEWLRGLESEAANLGAVMRHLLEHDEFDRAAEFAWSLYLYLWIGGYLGLMRSWMAELLELAERRGRALAERTRAIALYYTHAIRYWQDSEFDVTPGLRESAALFAAAGDRAGAALAGISVALALLSQPSDPDVPAARAEFDRSLAGFRASGDTWGEAVALIMLGRIDMLLGDLAAAREHFEQSLTLATAKGERLGMTIALNHRGWSRFLAGDVDGGADDFAASLDLSLVMNHDEGIAYGLEGLVGVRAARGDATGAGLILGAAQTVRRRKGIRNPGAFEFFQLPLQALRAAGGGPDLDAATERGTALTVPEILAYVRA